MKTLSFYLIVMPFLFFGCSPRIIFQRPVPVESNIALDMPDEMLGLYQVIEEDNDDGDLGLLKIEKIGKGIISAIFFDQLSTEDTVRYFENGVAKDSSLLAIDETGATIISNGDTVKVEFLEYEGKLYQSHFSDMNFILDINRGLFINKNNEKESVGAVYKQFGDDFFINILEPEIWLIHLALKDDVLILSDSYLDIPEDEFENNLSYYQTITEIKEQEGNDYLVNPTVAELKQLINEPGIFEKTVFKKVDDLSDESSTKTFLSPIRTIALIVFVLALFSIIMIRKRLKEE